MHTQHGYNAEHCLPYLCFTRWTSTASIRLRRAFSVAEVVAASARMHMSLQFPQPALNYFRGIVGRKLGIMKGLPYFSVVDIHHSTPSILRRCRLGDRKGAQPVKSLASASVDRRIQYCIQGSDNRHRYSMAFIELKALLIVFRSSKASH